MKYKYKTLSGYLQNGQTWVRNGVTLEDALNELAADGYRVVSSVGVQSHVGIILVLEKEYDPAQEPVEEAAEEGKSE